MSVQRKLSGTVRLARAAHAVLAGLCVAASFGVAAPATADELGRLFFTPSERQDLDRRRAGNVADKPQAAVESLVTVNGQVTRSSGKTTTWINGVPQDDAYRGRDPTRVPVASGTARVPVKVGQTLDRSRGAVTDPLGDGEIRIHGAKAQ